MKKDKQLNKLKKLDSKIKQNRNIENGKKLTFSLTKNQKMPTNVFLAKPSKNTMQNRNAQIVESEVVKNIMRKLKIQKIKFLSTSSSLPSAIRITYQITQKR